MKGVVKKNFPFALDGINITQLAAGTDFPPSGYTVQDKTFDGLAAAGFIEATEDSTLPADEQLNRRIIDALDKRLGAMSDEELKAVIARRGTPFSGNMVHAVLVGEAKTQMLAELEGQEPIRMVDPNSGVFEQPLSAPGQATPPSAAAAVQQQQVQADAAAADRKDATSQDGTNVGGENKATNQFDEPLPDLSKPVRKSEVELNTMNKAELEEYAKEISVDLSEAKTKADYIEALKPKAE